VLALIGLSGFLVIVGWVGYAFASGRNLKQRLTEPAPFPVEAPESAAPAAAAAH
jgi:hypothetical protein